MPKKHRIFISSVQKEFALERRTLRDFIEGDALLRQFFDVFLFEDLPASDRRPDEVYLDEVDRCDLYVGLFGNSHGSEGKDGLSPTELEFDRATTAAKPRVIFVKGDSDSARDPQMLALIRKAGTQLIRRRFAGVPQLIAGV
jgi:ATP-dependent DNA helicase RecG